MAEFKCPQCGTLVTGTPGQEAICGNCGFRAPVPVGGPEILATPVPPAPEESILRSVHMWAYLLSVAAIGTFFLAKFVVPFVLGVAGTTLGFLAHVRDRTDRRGFLAIILGFVALGLCAVYVLAF